jgi:hypothetical protein
LADIGEGAVSIVVEEPAGRRLVQRRNAIPGLVIRDAIEIFGFIEIDEVADKQIQPSVVVIVEPHRTRSPSGGGNAGFLGNVTKGTVAVVVYRMQFPYWVT